MHTYTIVEEGISPEKAEKALILLHGRGGTAEDILSLAGHFVSSAFYVAAPQATGNSWYPRTFMSPVIANEPWLTSAIGIVGKLIDSVRLHLPANNIYIMGFSQGACLALETIARNPARYAGVAAFSGGLIGEELNTSNYSTGLAGTKIFIGNSDSDPHIPLQRTVESAEIMRNLGGDVTLRIWPGMAHTVIPEEISAVKDLMF